LLFYFKQLKHLFILHLVKNIANDFLHLLYPHVCIGCGNDVLHAEQLICTECFAQLPETDYFKFEDNPVQRRFAGRMVVQHAGSTFHFTTKSVMQNIVFAMKYQGNRDAGIFLGRQTGKALLQTKWHTNIDVIVPIPLNKRKLQQRGYNQAALIANGIAEIINKPVVEDVAIRSVYTETQTHKDRISRWQNMQYVFTVHNAEALHNKHVLLVDDIITTGATTEACGQYITALPGTTLSIASAAYTI
jgi:ComF family protein